MDYSQYRQLLSGPGAGDARYRLLADAVAAAIGRGELSAGERLPSERDLATRLAVSRTTVVDTYQELTARGLVRRQVGRGTFVCAAPERADAPFAWRGKVAVGSQRTVDPSMRSIVRAAADASLISFAAGVTALDCFPAAQFARATERVLRQGPAVSVGFGPTEGMFPLRAAIAARSGARPEQVLITSGAQQGIDLLARCLLDPGDTVVLDRPGYLGAIQTFRAAGAHLAGWDVARADPEELEDLILRYRPKFLYTNPSFQNPTGQTLPLAARQTLLELAARYRLPVVEDEPYRELYFDRPAPPTLYQLDTQQLVIHLGTFSKCLAAGLRLGWLVAPEAVVEQLALVKQRSDLFNPPLPQLVLAELLTAGTFDAHLRGLRAELAVRHRSLVAALARYVPPGALRYVPVKGGLHIWCTLGHGVEAVPLLEAATARGVVFVNGEQFYADGAGRHQLRLVFSAVTPVQAEEGVRRLAALLAEAPRRPTGDGVRAVV